MPIVDLAKATVMLMAEVLVIWGLMYVIKLWIDRSHLLRRDVRPAESLDIRPDTISPPAIRKLDLGYAELRQEEAEFGRTIYYTDKGAAGEDRPNLRTGPNIVPEEANFVCTLDKKL